MHMSLYNRLIRSKISIVGVTAKSEGNFLKFCVDNNIQNISFKSASREIGINKVLNQESSNCYYVDLVDDFFDFRKSASAIENMRDLAERNNVSLVFLLFLNSELRGVSTYMSSTRIMQAADFVVTITDDIKVIKDREVSNTTYQLS